jgi:hypothetical protein
MTERKKRSKQPKVPIEALDHLCDELEALRNRHIDVEQSGRFFYVTHNGQPLCRLGYRGEIETWDFAIYKYSRQSYVPGTDLFPLFGKAGACVRMALHAYNLI